MQVSEINWYIIRYFLSWWHDLLPSVVCEDKDNKLSKSKHVQLKINYECYLLGFNLHFIMGKVRSIVTHQKKWLISLCGDVFHTSTALVWTTQNSERYNDWYFFEGNTKKIPYATTPWFSVSIQLSIQQNYQQIFSQFSLKWEEIDIFPAITVKYSSFKKDFGCPVMYVYLTPISAILIFTLQGKPTYVYMWSC